MAASQKSSSSIRTTTGHDSPSSDQQIPSGFGIPTCATSESDEPETLRRIEAEDGPTDSRRTALDCLRRIADSLSRLVDHFDPPPPDIVGTPYVANKLGCTTDWVAVMVREGEIPDSCLIPGTGNGKPWKFRRARIDQWIERR